MNTGKVNRVEIINYIDSKGRVYSWGPRPGVKVEVSLQDDGRTLKVFLDKSDVSSQGGV